jgi:hypothetical protein
MAVLTACGGSSSSSTTPSPEDAADVVVRSFRLPDATRSCLVDGFSQRSAARAAIATSEEPTMSEQEALGDVVEACVADETFAASVAAAITSTLPPADTTQAEDQTACLNDAVLALSDGEHRTLLVGLLTLGGGPLDSDLAMARNDLVNGIYATCGVTVGS